MAAPSSPTTVSAKAQVFGHDPTSVQLTLVPRTTRWRAVRAAPFLVGGIVLAPILGILPPHAPWAVGAGGGGLYMALRKWGERFTFVGVEGICPRCGAGLNLSGAPPLKMPHRIPCDACGNPVSITVEPGELERLRTSAA